MRSEEKGTSESLTGQVEGANRPVEAIKRQVPAPREQPQGATERFVGTLDIVDSEGRMAFQFDADNRRILAWDGEDREVLRFYGNPAQLYVGGEGNEGDFYVTDGGGKNFVHADSGSHRLRINDGDGQEFLRFESGEHRFFGYDEQGRRVLIFYGQRAQLYVGGDGNEGDLYIVHPSGVNTIQLDGNSGDIILRNAEDRKSVV